MSSPERRGGPREEHEPLPGYYLAARYADGRSSGAAYHQAQEALFETEYELSVYRFQLDQVWHVAVLGETPPPDFAETMQSLLSTGEPTTLPADLLSMLNKRRRQATKLGSWVEGHYRPEKRLK